MYATRKYVHCTRIQQTVALHDYNGERGAYTQLQY